MPRCPGIRGQRRRSGRAVPPPVGSILDWSTPRLGARSACGGGGRNGAAPPTNNTRLQSPARPNLESDALGLLHAKRNNLEFDVRENAPPRVRAEPFGRSPDLPRPAPRGCPPELLRPPRPATSSAAASVDDTPGSRSACGWAFSFVLLLLLWAVLLKGQLPLRLPNGTRHAGTLQGDQEGAASACSPSPGHESHFKARHTSKLLEQRFG